MPLCALAKSALRPTFSGAQKDWPSFLESWEAYWAKITGGEPKSDKIKLTLFVDSLDTTSQKEMEREQKFKGSQFTYAQVLARLEARFGLGRQSLCKQEFENLSCGEGKMSLEDWHKFRVDFLTLVSEMGKSDEAACEDLKRKLPKGMAHWVAKKEVKLENEFPSVEVTMPQAFNLPSLKGFITRFSGYEPTSLIDLGGNKWRVAWNNRTAVENMLSRNNFKVEIGNQVAGKVRVQPAETRLTLEETVIAHHRKVGHERAEGNENVAEGERSPQGKRALASDTSGGSCPSRKANTPLTLEEGKEELFFRFKLGVFLRKFLLSRRSCKCG